MIRGFRDLIAYQKAYQMSLDMHRLTMKLPRFEQMELASQLRRASKSIALNIAEGYGRKYRSTLADFRRFIVIAMGSCDEVNALLDYCRDLGYINDQEHNEHIKACNEIGKLLSSMLTWT